MVNQFKGHDIMLRDYVQKTLNLEIGAHVSLFLCPQNPKSGDEIQIILRKVHPLRGGGNDGCGPCCLEEFEMSILAHAKYYSLRMLLDGCQLPEDS